MDVLRSTLYQVLYDVRLKLLIKELILRSVFSEHLRQRRKKWKSVLFSNISLPFSLNAPSHVQRRSTLYVSKKFIVHVIERCRVFSQKSAERNIIPCLRLRWRFLQEHTWRGILYYLWEGSLLKIGECSYHQKITEEVSKNVTWFCLLYRFMSIILYLNCKHFELQTFWIIHTEHFNQDRRRRICVI